MKSANRVSVGFITGFLTCFLLFGGTVALAASGVLAEKSTSRVYVDGREVQMEAYLIDGRNYVQLREIGKNVGFDVSWDNATKSVVIESDKPYTDEDAPVATAAPAKQFPEILDNVPDVGDRIICDDGYVYEITDMSRYDSNVFADGPVGDLPEPTCDWSKFPTLTLPRMEKRHFSTPTGEDLFVRNMKETRRMQYTIYNALGNEPEAWRNGEPLATVSLTIPKEDSDYAASFWPWRESQLTDLVYSRPLSGFSVDACDVYHNGVFQYVRYIVLSL